MKTIKIKLKKEEKLHLAKPNGVGFLFTDAREHKTPFKIKAKDGRIITSDEIYSLARKQKELQAEKRQLKGLTRDELSAVFNAVEKYDEKRRKKENEKQKEVIQLKEELSEHKEELPRQDTELPEFLHKDKNLVIMTVDYDRLSKLSHNDLFNELKKDNPFLTEKTKVTLKPLG